MDKFKDHIIIEDNEFQYIKEFISRKVRSGGRNLTESEIKIIHACRAMLENPSILLLDESALDFENLDNSFFFESLWGVLEDTSFLAVMNGFEHVMLYDEVLEIDQGKVINKG